MHITATLRLALPLVAGQLAVIGQNVVDMILAGHRGAHVLGAVAVGTNLWGLAIMTMVGCMMSVPPSVAQLDGAGRRREIGPLFRQSLWLALALGLVLGVLVYVAGPMAAVAAGVAPDLIPDVTAFLHAAAWGTPSVSLYLACRGLSEGLSQPRPSMFFSILGLLTQLPVGYVLMYSLGLDAFGAGLAGTITGWLQLTAFAVFMRLSPRYRNLGGSLGPRGPDVAALAALLRLGAPMAASVIMEIGLFTGASLVIARFGDQAIAGHQIALSVASVTFMVPLGIAMATTVRVGNAVGRLDPAGVRGAAHAGVMLALGSQLLGCATMLLFPGIIAGLYTNDAAAIAMATSLLFLAALFQLSDGLQVVANGALRGLKDTSFPMLITGTAYWIVGMPLGWYLAIARDWQARGMWVGLIAGLSVAAVLLAARFEILSRRRIYQQMTGLRRDPINPIL